MSTNKKALQLSYFTVGYNLIEGVVSIASGLIAGSSALIGFGTDSFVESLSGSVMIWRFRKGNDLSHEESEKVEQKAVTLVSYTFFILGAYVLYESGKSFYLQEPPEKSLIGIIIAVASLIVMPILTYMKFKTGKELKSRSLVADSKQTLACVILSVVLLIGLGLNYFFGLWGADPLAGIVIAGFLFKEGYHTYKEKELCEG
jgi:cation diffusion facilitator family transporter